MTPLVHHDTFLAWPNGGGETPCTSAYLAAHEGREEAERLAVEAEEDEDWDQYAAQLARADRLRIELEALQEQGHRGPPVEYGKTIPGMALLGGATMTADGRVYNGDHLVGRV